MLTFSTFCCPCNSYFGLSGLLRKDASEPRVVNFGDAGDTAPLSTYGVGPPRLTSHVALSDPYSTASSISGGFASDLPQLVAGELGAD